MKKTKMGGSRYDKNGNLISVKKKKFIEPISRSLKFEKSEFEIITKKLNLKLNTYVNELIKEDLKKRGELD